MTNRKRYYNPKLDQRVLPMKVSAAMREAIENDTYGWDTEKAGGPLNEPDSDHPYNLVSSLCDDGLHRIAIDIDRAVTVEACETGAWISWTDSDEMEHFTWVEGCKVVASSTAGHCHIYGTKPYEWIDYVRILMRFALDELIEVRYAAASISRGQSLLRPPHVQKLAVEPQAETEDPDGW